MPSRDIRRVLCAGTVTAFARRTVPGLFLSRSRSMETPSSGESAKTKVSSRSPTLRISKYAAAVCPLDGTIRPPLILIFGAGSPAAPVAV
ncbi:hypothetical protein SVIO_105680 [Streptomyces violaceusniger]|uniref:Uncharacterized protein n=1 Tax=Streptomyces violaceusniger TaxID=68280 RepID=A0A4D4LG25_STRVO|nr:hypothetical protein SVIO_105680 [Streptomyces violaceusniger]